MRIAILQLPGSNCDRDTFYALVSVFQQPTKLFWHKRDTLAGADAVIIPGGFSYGDYLRAGAIAQFSPIIREVKTFADNGGLVLGICNGFQILCELGLLPGALIRNRCLEFRCELSTLIVQDSMDYFNVDSLGPSIQLPIAHGEGNYQIDDAGLAELEENRQILLKYRDNPNGSMGDIAGVRNKAGNVFGLMPHPERAVEEQIHSTTDGIGFLKAFLYQAKRLQEAAAAAG